MSDAHEINAANWQTIKDGEAACAKRADELLSATGRMLSWEASLMSKIADDGMTMDDEEELLQLAEYRDRIATANALNTAYADEWIRLRIYQTGRDLET